MTTRVFRAGECGLAPTELREVARLLLAGEVVALPTETVYGLAANALDPSACTKIFEAKERPFSDPLICHLPDNSWIDRLAIPEPRALLLARQFWPGPLTLVLQKTAAVTGIVTAGQNTVALRRSSHPVMARIIEETGVPLAAPSANRFGRISPTTAAHVLDELGGRIPLVVDGGPCERGIESTIVELLPGGFRILRKGPVDEQAIAAALGQLPSLSERPIAAPGTLPWHYAPSTPLRLVPSASDAIPLASMTTGLLAWKSPAPGNWRHVEILTPDGNAETAAARLYAALRALDHSGIQLIVAEMPPAEPPICEAIAERLRKASARPAQGSCMSAASP